LHWERRSEYLWLEGGKLGFISAYADKKESKIFLIYKEIQMGSGAKSYMRKGFVIYEEMDKYFHHK
jgi:hypothetical protein